MFEIIDVPGIVNFHLNFDVGYMSGNHRVCFTEKDIGSVFQGIAKRVNQLWWEGIIQSEPSLKRKRSNDSIPGDSSNSDDDIPELEIRI